MLIYEQPRIKFNILKSNKDNTDMTFVLSGLMKGMGQGLANFLRIAGYSYSMGYAPIAYKLTDVSFALDTSDKYTEKVDIITNNIRKILVRPDRKSNSGFRTAFRLTYSGVFSGDLTLDDLNAVDLNGEPIEVIKINPELKILNMSSEERIDIDILVYFGVGYIGSEDIISNVPDNIKTMLNSMIRLDVTFDGIKYLNYRLLENTPIMDQETIALQIRTNGTITAYEELTFLGKLLKEHIEPLSNLYKMDWDQTKVSQDIFDSDLSTKISTEMGIRSKESVTSELLWESEDQNDRVKTLSGKSENDDFIVENLPLKPKAYNWLKGNNLQCIRDLRKYNETTGENEYPEDIKEELMRALRDVGIYEVFESKINK